MIHSEAVFDFTMGVTETDWLVDGLIPMGDLTSLQSQAGVGKSFLAEQIAVCVLTETPCLGRAVQGGDVLFIDQDTPKRTLDNRLLMFYRGTGSPLKHKLFKYSMKDKYLSNGTLFKLIADHPGVVLVVIDSLRTTVGTLDMNQAKDMSILAVMKSRFLAETDGASPQRAIILNHHISEKKSWGIQEYMTMPASDLAMFSSTINQDLDTYYVLAAKPNVGGKLTELFIRPVAKRTLLDVNPMSVDLAETPNGGLEFRYVSDYSTEIDSECHKDILRLFSAVPESRGAYKVYMDMKQKWGINRVRDCLRDLVTAGRLSETIRQSNLFEFALADRTVNLRSVLMKKEE